MTENFEHIKSIKSKQLCEGLPNSKGAIETCDPFTEAKAKSISFKPIKKTEFERLVGCRVKANCPHVGPGWAYRGSF